MPLKAVLRTVWLLRLTSGTALPAFWRLAAPRPTPVAPIDRSRFSA
jgi:hypothetical protein